VPSLIRYGKLSDGDRVIDVGCVLPKFAKIEAAIGVDLATYAEAARARSTDRRITFKEADARELPFDHDFFDRAFSMLVLIGGRLRLARVFGAIHRRILRGSLARLTRNVRRTDLVDRPVPRS
jgi:hypothetical protein